MAARNPLPDKARDPAAELLLVEDDQDHADLALGILAREAPAVRVRRFADGQAALEHLQALSPADPLPRCMLLDLRLPRMPGLEVLRRIKEDPRLRPMPVVIFTSSEQDADLRQAMASHANSYLVKPLEYQALRGLLQAVASYWLHLNRQPAPESLAHSARDP